MLRKERQTLVCCRIQRFQSNCTSHTNTILWYCTFESLRMVFVITMTRRQITFALNKEMQIFAAVRQRVVGRERGTNKNLV